MLRADNQSRSPTMTPSQNLLCLAASLRQLESRYADLALMQRAGDAAASFSTRITASRTQGPILILAGPGNNGGDALEAGRLLRHAFYDVHLVLAGDAKALPPDAEAACQRFVHEGGKLLEEIPAGLNWQLIIDGLFGIGLTRAPTGKYSHLIQAANHLRAAHACPLLALDCPSGLNTDTGQAFETCISATHTLTFIANKPGLHTLDGPDHSGTVQLATLEIPLDTAIADGELLSLPALAPALIRRKHNSHKGTYGSAGILGGCKGMLGATLMAGRAALHLGAGRVYLAPLDTSAPSHDPLQPELMFRTPAELAGLALQALACGPGLGTSVDAIRHLDRILALDTPTLLDADALNLLAREGNLKVTLANRQAPTLLTPHPLEAARLLEISCEEIQQNRIDAALNLAEEYASWVALKGCGTIIASPEGQWWINPSGNPGMATAGMGDVLSGIVLAILAQGISPGEALKLGVYLHGAAADTLASQGIGPIGLCASETIPVARALLNQWVVGGIQP